MEDDELNEGEVEVEKEEETTGIYKSDIMRER